MMKKNAKLQSHHTTQHIIGKSQHIIGKIHHTTQHMKGKRDQQHIHMATQNLPTIPKKNAKLSGLVRKFLKKRANMLRSLTKITMVKLNTRKRKNVKLHTQRNVMRRKNVKLKSHHTTQHMKGKSHHTRQHTIEG